MKSNTYYFVSPDIKVDNKTLLVNEEFYPIKNTESIFIVGSYELNSQLISLFDRENVLVHFGNYYGKYIGTYYPASKRYNNKLVMEQYSLMIENKRTQKFEKMISKEYVKLICSMLRYYDRIGFCQLDDEQLNEVSELKDIKKFIDEAIIKKFYFKYFCQIINKHGWGLVSREYHQNSLNPINSLLSLYYSLIYKDTITSIYKHGLDPRISYLHAINNRNANTLQFDISDHYKILLVDRLVIQLVREQKINKDMFEDSGKIKQGYIKKLIGLYEEFMEKQHKYNIGRLSGKQVIDKQVEMYKNYLKNEDKIVGIKLR